MLARPFSIRTLTCRHYGTFDIGIIGGGILGLSTALEIRKQFPKFSIAILEKESNISRHQTGHNSGVIHAGMYYTPGSNMAKACVSGSALMFDYCDKNKLPCNRVGKLIVAVNEKEHLMVKKLFNRGCENKVEGLHVLTASEVKNQEPALESAYSALWSPNTGIVDYQAVAKCIENELNSSGKVQVKCNFEVQRLHQTVNGNEILIKGCEPGQYGPLKEICVKYIIICAGLYTDHISTLANGSNYPRISAFRGSYYQMKSKYKDIVKTNVYPVPIEGAGIPVGIHFTPTVNQDRGSQMIIGPSSCPTFSREGYRVTDVNVSDAWHFITNIGFLSFILKHPLECINEIKKDINKQQFIQAAKNLVPSLNESMIEPSFTGVMSQVFDKNGNICNDYIFERNLMNNKVLAIRNAPSPAATSSFAIAQYIVSLAKSDFGWQ